MEIHELDAHGVLHPRVGGDDEERREPAADHREPERGQMQALGQTVPAEDPQSEERGLDEEGEQPLHRERCSEDVADEARVVAPGHPELELLNDAGRDAEGEVDEVELAPELRHPQVALVLRAHPRGLHPGHQEGQSDGQRYEDEVVHGGDAELPPREIERVHCRPFPKVTLTLCQSGLC